MWGLPGACVALATFGASAGCANNEALETEMSRLRRELHFVRQDLSKQKRSVEELERRMTLVALGKGPSAAPTGSRNLRPQTLGSEPLVDNAPPPVSVSMMRPVAPPPAREESAAAPSRRKALPVVRLGANAEPKAPARQEEWVDPGAQDDGGPPLKFTMAGEDEDAREPRLSVDRSVLSRPDPVLDPERPRPKDAPAVPTAPPRRTKSRAQIKAQYKAALAKLRERNEPQVALKMFDRFLAANPKSRFADNAAYWRGECLFALVKHEEAIVAFDTVVQRYPRSAKVPFALLRKAESLIALKRKAEAVTALKTVIDQHGSSEAAESAKRMLKQATTGK